VDREQPQADKKSELKKFQMTLFVDHQGKIDIWALTEREREFVGRDSEISAFVKRMAAECESLLVCDKSPERDIVWLLLGKEIQQNSIESRKIYTSKYGFDIIWLPWGSETKITAYHDIITINHSLI
jgi:hypothetical protein